MAEHHYEVEVTWSGATTGYREYSRNHLVRAAGQPDLPGSADPVIGRGDGSRWDPEQLLVASLAQCHMLWYLHLCTEAGIVVTEYRDAATGTMGAERFHTVVLHPRVTITDPARTADAAALHDAAHAKCFIANSVAFPVTHEPEIRARS
ncbi:OsmC family protein [Nocardia stercoris]|uniref:OsmC family peroxiredoxin n=1 Tax=Nocardia stercoris TaxID=2483361 RepID=A0A3M2KVD0_9NOCA|nr:OsmC family protein [Nocardia stercoris]RMI29419.1 OsmC family peroxiredoxin [Nocardia stercoris]